MFAQIDASPNVAYEIQEDQVIARRAGLRRVDRSVYGNAAAAEREDPADLASGPEPDHLSCDGPGDDAVSGCGGLHAVCPVAERARVIDQHVGKR